MKTGLNTGDTVAVVVYDDDAWAAFWIDKDDNVIFNMANPYAARRFTRGTF